MTVRIINPLEITARVLELYRNGLPRGDLTGWPSLDRYYTVMPGQLTIVTGWPSSGKSEWLDALAVNLAHQGWCFAVFSPENKPEELHVSKHLEKRLGKPFGPGPNERMTEDEVTADSAKLHQRFAFMGADAADAPRIREIIEVASEWLRPKTRFKRGLIVDPWNELEHWRPTNLSETEYVSQTLSYVRSWARETQTHVWLMAHPRNARREDGKLPIPRPDMISGSQHWWNKADCAITVWRDMETPDSQNVEIHVQKVRFKHIGRPGIVDLKWDRVTGRYHEVPSLKDVSAYRRTRGEDE